MHQDTDRGPTGENGAVSAACGLDALQPDDCSLLARVSETDTQTTNSHLT